MYYEAILQLRPADKKVLDFTKKRVKKNNVSITKIEKLKTGIDLYLTSKRFAMSLGRKLKRNFKGKLIVTKKLHTVDKMTSKKVYRITVCFRLET